MHSPKSELCFLVSPHFLVSPSRWILHRLFFAQIPFSTLPPEMGGMEGGLKPKVEPADREEELQGTEAERVGVGTAPPPDAVICRSCLIGPECGLKLPNRLPNFCLICAGNCLIACLIACLIFLCNLGFFYIGDTLRDRPATPELGTFVPNGRRHGASRRPCKNRKSD